MNCPECHQPLREGAQFCTRCGTHTSQGGVDSLSATQASAGAAGESVPTVRRESADASATSDSTPTVIESDPLVGRVLDGKYEVVAPLGAGGMGAVYLARRVLIGDEVAVKVLHTKFIGNQTLVERFRREARAAAQLHHPNVVTIHDYGEARGPEGFAYIVMELVRGESLRDLLRREGRLGAERAVSLMRGVCAGVGAAHRRGIVHRDLKPDNVIVVPADEDNPSEHVKVVDFGIAKLRDMAAEATLTHVGAVVGTPNYMSPEQCKGERLDARADVYSLGAMLYEMLAGSPPFNAPSIPGIIIKHVTEPPPPVPEDLRVPAALQEAIARSLSKDPEARQRDASEFARDIQAALTTPTDKAGQQPSVIVFNGETRPEAVVPLPAPPTAAEPPATLPPSALPSLTAASADASHTAPPNQPTHTQPSAQQTHTQPAPPQTFNQPSQTFNAPPPFNAPPAYNAPRPAPNAPRRRSRAPLVIGLVVLLLAGLGIVGLIGLIYLGSQGGSETANAGARRTPTQSSNRNTANANAVVNANAANANASEGNANAAPTFEDAQAISRAEQKIVAGKLLAGSDLAGLSAAQLRILRNAVYARYGRTFQSADLQSYFQSRPWYHPRADYSEQMLTAGDRANADLIKSFEEGGASSSTPAATADAATVKKEVASALEGWADSLRERDINAHMSFYADTLETFYNRQNVPASQVRSDRSRAFSHYDSMDVTISDLEITPDPSGTRAVAAFDKSWDFESDSRHATGSVRQQLTLTNVGGRWLITSERDLKVYSTSSEEN
ncbi:MAG TPA: protein kinase [Pyrinomonadaceae bacterium]|nr:protein kinase [Pyrinomonadaceae bacterium]